MNDFITDIKDANTLHNWLRQVLNLNIPRKAVCRGHNAPFDYIEKAFFEPTRDKIVWAPRGGGKTRLAAVATLLDLLHKPNCSVRILGGSLEQSLRMWEHLAPDVFEHARPMIDKSGLRSKRIRMRNGATAAVLTASQRSVRGLRVQKLRCDEVDAFAPDIWDAAQFVTRSTSGARSSIRVTGSVDAISTLHKPFGLMSELVDRAKETNAMLFKWCLLDVLEQCPPQRECKTCPLWNDCGGIAKTTQGGFVKIDDAIAIKLRSSKESWETEMLCKRPSVKANVFPTFDRQVHVRECVASHGDRAAMSLAIDFGFAAPFVCLWVREEHDVVHVIDEYVQEQRTVPEHLDHIALRKHGDVKRVACDPAGGARNEQTAASSIKLLKNAGYEVHSRRSGILEGIEMLRAAIGPATGEPRLFIHPRCVQLIRSLERYHYAERPDGLPRSELPLKDGTYDHAVDALRYYFANRGRNFKTETRSY